MSYEVQNLNRRAPALTLRAIAADVVIFMWGCIQRTVFSHSPQFMYGWRRLLLRAFGAKIGRNVIIRPSVRVTSPWKLTVGDYSWIGDDAVLYCLAPIRIGCHVVVSQKSYLCGGGHDYHDIHFPQTIAPICIEDEAWVAADVFIAPGVTIGRGAVIGARSTVLKSVAPMVVAAGYPLRVIGPRNKQTPKGMAT